MAKNEKNTSAHDHGRDHFHERGVITHDDLFKARHLVVNDRSTADELVKNFVKKVGMHQETQKNETEGKEGYILTKKMLDQLCSLIDPGKEDEQCVLLSIGYGPKTTEYVHEGEVTTQETFHFVARRVAFKSSDGDHGTLVSSPKLENGKEVVLSTYEQNEYGALGYERADAVATVHIPIPPSKPPYDP